MDHHHQDTRELEQPSRDVSSLRIDLEEAEATKDVPFVLVSSTRNQKAKIEPTTPLKQELTAAPKDVIPDGRFTPKLITSWLIAVTWSLQFAYNIGTTGALKSSIIFPGHTKFSWSMCVAAFSIGGLFGALGGGRICSFMARKQVMFIDAIIYIAAGAVMGLSTNMMMLTAGRFIVGVAGGMSTMVVPLYLKEIAPANLRGALGAGHQVAAVFAVLLADLLAFPWSGKSDGWAHPGWRMVMGFSAIMGVAQLLLMPLLAETPVYLVGAKRADEATKVLASLRGVEEGEVASEIDSIYQALNDKGDDEGEASLWSVICDRSIRRPLVVGIVLHACMRLSGFNAVTFYANTFFEEFGMSKPLIGTTLVGVVNFLATIVALVLIDRKGRRPLLIKSAIGMLVSALVLTLALMGLMPIKSVIEVAAVMGFVAFFEIGLGPVPWMLVPEMLPAQSRAKGCSLGIMVNWACLCVVGLIFPTMQAKLKDFTFMPFAVMHVVALLVVLKWLPETKGKSPKEIAAAMQEMKRK